MVNNSKFIIAYVGDNGLASLTKEDALKLTHINVAFGHIKEHRITVDLKNIDYLQQIKNYNPKIKILLSIGGWSADGFSQAASSDYSRKIFATTSVETIINYGFDGIDLDWEYPCYSQGGIASSKDDKQNFTLLLKEIRQALDTLENKYNKHFLLTIATGADEYYIHGTDMKNAQKYLDYIQLMTYDMRGGFQTLTGHHTNLYTPTGDLFRISVDASTRIFLNAGVPKEKIIIGAAFYSRMWKDVPNINNGLYQSSPKSGGYGPEYTMLLENYINKNSYTKYWDDEAKAPYLFNGNEFITYDDEESIINKAKYVLETDIAGIMFWQYECDKSGTLLNAMHSILK